LGKVQAGPEPDDWKPFGDVGAGKTQVTGKQDRAIAAARYRAVVNAKKQKE